MVNSPLIRPAIYWGGSFGGGTLDSHDTRVSGWVRDRNDRDRKLGYFAYLRDVSNLPL